jgi:tetratricopeptide (TPR) repeat protein
MNRTEAVGVLAAGRRRWAGPCLPWLLAAFVCAGWADTAQAQLGLSRDVPSQTYFANLDIFYDGDYRNALNGFSREVGGAIKTVQARWIDSICYYTMLGECHYQMGNLTQAMAAYNTAMQVYLANSNWLMQVDFSQSLKPGASANITPWGASKRQLRVAIFNPKLKMTVGSNNAAQVASQGGVLSQPQIIAVNAREIVRCTTLALRRRRELLGAACEHDPLTKKLVATLAARPGQRNNWSEAWIDVQLGLAHVSENKIPQAMLTLQRSVAAAGQYDHPLTCVALLELGRLALEAGDFPGAAELCAEASYSAAQFGDYGVLEEAFRYGLQAHLRGNAAGVYPPLVVATNWANSQGFRQLKASLLVLTAENLAHLRDPNRAGVLLTQARATMARRAMLNGRLGARLNFTTALVNYQKGVSGPGDVALAAALKYQQQGGSHRLFELTMADQLATQQVVTSRAAKSLYQIVLREPTAADWESDPLETLSVLMSPHPGPYERWFTLTVDRQSELDEALEIADRARRHRFFSTLPLGGRGLALEWLLAAPDAALDNPQLLERRSLLGRYPEYDQLARKAEELRQAIHAIPLDDEDQAETRTKLVRDLGEVSATQMLQLRALSLRREPSAFVFPPLRKTADVRKALPAKHGLLAFFRAGSQLYGFLVTKDRSAVWLVPSPAGVTKQTAALLRELGQFDGNREVETAKLKDDGWKELAGNLLDSLMKGSGVNLGQNIEELVIVPDGDLWYVPFEALQVSTKDGADREALLDKMRIRYAPTVGLAVADGRTRSRSANLGVVLGKLFPRDKAAVAEKAFEEIEKETPEAVALSAPWPQPLPALGVQLDRLLVLDDLTNLAGGPYDWSPIQVPGGRGAGSLAQWMSLPLGGPELLVLPGFHTGAENGMKRTSSLGAGNDVFLSVCGLLASGSRTVLLSRWRTGGASSVTAMGEFLRDSTKLEPAEAWKKSLTNVRQATLDAAREPRLRRMPVGETLKAEHPFFWAGYLLVDPGRVGAYTQPAAAPGAKPKPPAAQPAGNGKAAAPKPPAAAPAAGAKKVSPVTPLGNDPPDAEVKPADEPAAEEPAEADAPKADGAVEPEAEPSDSLDSLDTPVDKEADVDADIPD